MRITEIKIDGFGVWSRLELGALSDQLNVFYGPNEAGKTTLMQFLRSMLYGFSAERRARYLPPLGGHKAGGALAVADGQETFFVSRHIDESAEKGETLTIHDRRDAPADERALGALLGDVDEPIFNNVFAFGLAEIQELGTLTDTQAASELYNLALGLDRVSLVDVLSELDASRNRLLALDGRPSLVTQLLGQRERLHDEIAELGQATTRYLTLSAQRQSLVGEIARLESEQLRCDEQARQMAIARSLKDRWHRRAAIDTQLELLRATDTLPADALARFDRLGARWSLRRRRFQRLKQKRRRLGKEIDELAVNEALCSHAARFEALAEQQQWIEWLAAQVARLEEEALELESELEQVQPGIKPSDAGRTGLLSRQKLDELRTTAKALRAARREARRLSQRSAAAGKTSTESVQKIDAALGGAREKGLTQALAEAGELVSQLRKRVQLDERLDQLSRRAAQLEEQSHEHLERQILPTWALAGLGSFFVLGSALVLLFVAGLVLPESLSGALGWPVGLVGVLTAGTAGAVKLGMERGARSELDDCHRQLGLLKEQTDEARTERDELDASLPRGGGPLVARLQSAEKSLASLEALLPLEREREAALREAEAAAAETGRKAGEWKPLRKKWRRLLAEAGLPSDIAPKDLPAHSHRLARVRDLHRQLAERNAELTRRRGEYETLAGRMRHLVAATGIVPRSQVPLDQLRQCLAELGEQQKLLKQRTSLKRASDRLRRKGRQLAVEAKRLQARRRLLLDASGALDEAEFRRRAAAQAECQRLAAERATLCHEISTALATEYTEAQLSDWLAPARNLEQLENENSEARRALRERLTKAVERRGEMNEQLKMLIENRQLAHMQLELGIVERRLLDALDRWRVLAACGMILTAVRDYYEREHQPQALREASGYLNRLTGGRYRRVWTPLGEHGLKVDDDQGRTLTVDVLSSGTREQLFLALRLALVGCYARRGMSLPLVLDDVLVNFDLARAKAAALVLRDFSRQGHQVFVFTCHEHIFKLFRSIKAETRVLPDRSRPEAETTDLAPGRAQRSVEIPSEPEEVPELPGDVEPMAAESELQAAEAPRTPPPSRAAPKRKVEPAPVRAPRPSSSTRWSAEEFEGELTDRVRADAAERVAQQDANERSATTADDDAEAA
jgi:uncharacterized protein YhaN